MARKPSVIMSAIERKAAKNDLKEEIARTKASLRTMNSGTTYLKAELKKQEKAVAAVAKTLLGLSTRAAALSPPKPIVA